MEAKRKEKGCVLLADGTKFYGYVLGKMGTAQGEICFNTGMTGYQEIFTDPSYKGQIMVTTNAHIGNYGTQDSDLESDTIKISGLVCKNFSLVHSRYSSDKDLKTFLEEKSLIVITDVDTRALVRHIRDKGAQNAIITSELDRIGELQKEFDKMPSMKGMALATEVSAKQPYYVGDKGASLKVAALDLGIKTNILRNLSKRDVYIKVFPADSSFEDMMEFKPDGFFISNGPGDPSPLKNAIDIAKKIIEQDKPLFGICLGHQVIAQAMGISTYKMHTGHRGINHPIVNHGTGKGEITSQNHGFAINREEAEAHTEVEVTHSHLNDDTVAGLKLKNKPVFSVQYHPEAGPGPNDATYLFDSFIDLMNQSKK